MRKQIETKKIQTICKICDSCSSLVINLKILFQSRLTKSNFEMGTFQLSAFSFTHLMMNYRSSSTNTLFTNLEVVDVNVQRVGLIRAGVDQIPFLKSIHFNVESNISRLTLDIFFYYSWRPSKFQTNVC